jgi:hypothetical protein
VGRLTRQRQHPPAALLRHRAFPIPALTDDRKTLSVHTPAKLGDEHTTFCNVISRVGFFIKKLTSYPPGSTDLASSNLQRGLRAPRPWRLLRAFGNSRSTLTSLSCRIGRVTMSSMAVLLRACRFLEKWDSSEATRWYHKRPS